MNHRTTGIVNNRLQRDDLDKRSKAMESGTRRGDGVGESGAIEGGEVHGDYVSFQNKLLIRFFGYKILTPSN